jgi:hypothetical protein
VSASFSTGKNCPPLCETYTDYDFRSATTATSEPKGNDRRRAVALSLTIPIPLPSMRSRSRQEGADRAILETVPDVFERLTWH